MALEKLGLPLLTAEEERDLARIMQTGDEAARQAARNKFVEHNLGLVVTIAKRYNRRGLAFDDRVQLAVLGVMWAAERYRPDIHTVRFATFACHCIRTKIRAALLEEQLIHVPAHCWWKNQRRPITPGGCARRDRAREQAVVASAEVISLSRPGRTELGERETRYEPLDPAPSIEARGEAREESEQARLAVAAGLGVLTEVERMVIKARHGLDGEMLTRRELGAQLGLCKERVRQIELGAMEKLRRELAPDCAAPPTRSRVRRTG